MRLVYSLGLITLFSAVALGRGGNGEGFNGGDPVHVKLQAARGGIQNALKWVKQDYAPERLCNARYCSYQDESCNTLRVLTTAAVSTCRAFLQESVAQYTQLLANNPNQFFIVKRQALKDPISRGEVAAITQSDAAAPIYFDSKKVSALTPEALFALLVHELGHKISFRGKLIDDRQGPEGYQTGRQFLDTVGVALFQYQKQLPAERSLAHLGITQLFRSHNPQTDSHFFTLSPTEHENVVHQGNRDESKSFTFFVFSYPIDGTVPVYRFVTKGGQYGYFLSRDLSAADKAKGYEYDSIAFHVWKEPRANTFEIFRLVNKLTGASLFTVSGAEVEAIIKNENWAKSESLGFIPQN